MCGDVRAFVSSGLIRLNANGRRLDAWLIYRCADCDRTWNRPIAERLAVAAIPKADLLAMQASEADWVRRHEFDTAGLRRHCDAIEIAADVTVTKRPPPASDGRWSAIAIGIAAPQPTGLRLDRLLAGELGLPRAALAALQRAGGLSVEPAAGADLSRKVAGSLTVRLTAADLSAEQRDHVGRVLLG